MSSKVGLGMAGMGNMVASLMSAADSAGRHSGIAGWKRKKAAKRAGLTEGLEGLHLAQERSVIQFASMFTNPILIKVFDAWRRYVIISRFEREERDALNLQISQKLNRASAEQSVKPQKPKRGVEVGSSEVAAVQAAMRRKASSYARNTSRESRNTYVLPPGWDRYVRRTHDSEYPSWPTMSRLRAAGLIPKKIIKMEDIFKLPERKDPVEEEPWVAQLSSRLTAALSTAVEILSHRAWSPTPDGHAETGPVSPIQEGIEVPSPEAKEVSSSRVEEGNVTNRTREETLSTLAGLLDNGMLSPDDFMRARSKLDVISEHSAADAPSADVQPSTQGERRPSLTKTMIEGLTTEKTDTGRKATQMISSFVLRMYEQNKSLQSAQDSSREAQDSSREA